MQVGDGLKDSLLFEGGGREGGREGREEDEWEGDSDNLFVTLSTLERWYP